ncbi:MAG: ribosome maturation factor RimP [Clostridia bacterium]|nr:ribosome maturation factor RimP [Clostridia bacterium]
MSKIEEKVEALLTNTIENLGYELYDVIYEKEAQNYYLRIFIDKPEGIDLNDCEKVNDTISNMLDEANYIKDPYFLEVSSPGIERMLRKEKHLQQSIGKEITLKLYQPIIVTNETEINSNKNKKKAISLKEIDGILQQFDENTITIKTKEDKILTMERNNIAMMNLKYHWE